MESYGICPFLSGSFHLEECPQFPSFLTLNKQHTPYSLYTLHYPFLDQRALGLLPLWTGVDNLL